MNINRPKHEILSAPLPLQPGTYRLTEAVKNPSPDRRCHQSRLTTWESWVVWPAGMEFIVDNMIKAKSQEPSRVFLELKISTLQLGQKTIKTMCGKRVPIASAIHGQDVTCLDCTAAILQEEEELDSLFKMLEAEKARLS